ncbi:hypothetical protein OY671_012470, partial [Metschnikowia pulcherrima]
RLRRRQPGAVFVHSGLSGGGADRPGDGADRGKRPEGPHDRGARSRAQAYRPERARPGAGAVGLRSQCGGDVPEPGSLGSHAARSRQSDRVRLGSQLPDRRDVIGVRRGGTDGVVRALSVAAVPGGGGAHAVVAWRLAGRGRRAATGQG